MASPDLSLRLDSTRAIVPQAENDLGLDYIGRGGTSLTLISGLPVKLALNYGLFNNDSFVNNAIKSAGGGLVPQTLSTAVYQNLHLIAGTQFYIDATFTPGEQHFNDESFALLKNNITGGIVSAGIANVQNVIDNAGGQTFRLAFRIDTTSDYNLMVGVADIGDKLHPSSLTIDALTTFVPGGQYAILPGGVRLADNSLLRSDGSLQIGNSVLPSFLSSSGSAVVSGLETLLQNNLISQDGGGVVSNDGGSVISNDGGSLISRDGGGVISNDGGSVISQDGGGFTGIGNLSAAQLAQMVANLTQANAFQIRAFAAASASGLASHNYGLQSLDADGGVPSSGGGGDQAIVPVPGVEVNASGGAVAKRFDDSSAVADLGGGKYVVAFNEYTRADSGVRTYAIRAQVFNADGSPSGPELTASPPLPPTTSVGTPANQLSDPSVAALRNGAFVVAWQNGNNVRTEGQGFSTGSDLFAQIFNADGSKSGNLIALDPGTNNYQFTDVKVASLTDGGFVAVWGLRPGTSSADLSSIHGQVFNADGTHRGAEFTLAGNTILADLSHPTVVGTADGGFAIAFQGSAVDHSGNGFRGVGAQSYDANGVAKARNPTVVTISSTDFIELPNLAVLPNGNIAVAWLDSASGFRSIYSQVLSPSLAPLHTDPTLVTPSAGSSFYGGPALTALSDGNFVVGWTDPSQIAVGQIMSGDNTLSGGTFPLYAPGGGDAELSPALVQLSTGALIATSTHVFNTFGASDVRALPLALGLPGAQTPVSSGGALRTGSAIHGYIAGGTVFADANGNGVLDPGEVSATTTANGAFALAPGATGPLVLAGGTDVATGRPFTDRFTAPAGSGAIDALTTLVQDVVARGADIGTAQMKVATALGLSADAALTELDPIVASQGSATARAVLLANAILADLNDLATAAGVPDALGAFATVIAAHDGFTPFDPTSVPALAAAGLSGQVLTDTAAIASAVKALITARGTADTGNPALLVQDVNRVQVVVQGAAAALSAAAPTGTTASVAADYTGAALQSKFAGAAITPATIGVYRFFDTQYGTHFFTASTAERDTILSTRPDLHDEGVGLNAVDPASGDPNASAVFRFFDTKFGTHFFTASAGERDQVLATRADLSFEGTGFYEHTTQQAGDTPVYRFFDKNFGTHFYTPDSGERASIIASRPDLVDEGIGFYAPKG